MRIYRTLVLSLICSSLVLANLNNVMAETLPAPAPPPATIFFTNVHVDANPVPHKPFTVTADVQSQSVNWSSLTVYLSAPSGISVVTPIIANLAFTNQGNTMRATWTIMAGDSGSYPLTITAHSNFPYDTETFNVTVNVGTPHSLIPTAIDVPGGIFPNNNFTVSLKLENTAGVEDNNVMAQIFVPAGLQLLDDVSKYSNSVGPNQVVEYDWKVRAENTGSYVITFNFSSSNSGMNSASAGVNIGNIMQPTGGLLTIKAHPATLLPNVVTPILFDISNSGVEEVHNLQIVSASGGGYASTNTPLWIGDLGLHDTKTVSLSIYMLNDTLSLQIPITTKYDANQNQFTETYQTQLPLGNQPVFKVNGISVTPPLSYAGDVGDRIDVQLFNFGLGANDVYATLKLPPGLAPAWGNSTSAYFGRLDTFHTVTASFYVSVDNTISSGSYPLTLLVTDGIQQTTMNVNFIVTPKAQFQLVSEDDSQLYPGATNALFKITMRNVGSEAAQTTTTTLLAGNSVPGVKSNTITSIGNQENIGTVLPGQTFVTTFMVDLDPQLAAGDQSTSVQINWSQNSTNTANNFVQTVVVPYHVANGPYYLMYYNSIPWTYVIGAAIFGTAIAAFAYKRRKRMQLMNKPLPYEIPQNKELPDRPDVRILEDISAEKNNERISNRARISAKESTRHTDDGDDVR